MSRQVDLTKDASDEDRQWLMDRARYADLAQLDNLTIQQVQAKEAADHREDDEVIFTPVSPYDKHVRANAGTATPASEHAGGDYDGWNKAQLQDEAERRDLPRSGSKADLVERLQEHDADAAGANTGDVGAPEDQDEVAFTDDSDEDD